jgi:hypothetical protein
MITDKGEVARKKKPAPVPLSAIPTQTPLYWNPGTYGD